MTDRNTIVQVIESLFEDWIDKNRNVHPLAVENMKLLEADALALLKEARKPDCEHAEHDGIGCLGYAGCTQDDEPIEVCKNCCMYTGNRYEEMNRDA